MSCPICLNFPSDFGNYCSCFVCQKTVCERCTYLLEINNKYICPMCRNNYSIVDIDSTIEILKKNKGKDSLAILARLYYECKNYNLFTSLMEQLPEYRGLLYHLAYRYYKDSEEKKKAFLLFCSLTDVSDSIYYMGKMLERGEGVKKRKKYGKILQKIGSKYKKYSFNIKTGKREFLLDTYGF